MKNEKKQEKEFELKGNFEEKNAKKGFVVSISAFNPEHAAEKAMCIIGSRYKKPRRKIFINEIKEKKEVIKNG